jgi:hypothetical protein
VADNRPLVLIGGVRQQLPVANGLIGGFGASLLTSSYLDLNFSGWGTLASGTYYLSGLGSAWSNKPIEAFMTSTATYLGLFYVVNNGSIHAVTAEFSTPNDTLFTGTRSISRSGASLAAAITSGWKSLSAKEYLSQVRYAANASATTAVDLNTYVLNAGTSAFTTDLANVFDTNGGANGTIRYLGPSGLRAKIMIDGAYRRSSGSAATEIRHGISINGDTPTASYAAADMIGSSQALPLAQRIVTLNTNDVITARAASTINWVAFYCLMRVMVLL